MLIQGGMEESGHACSGEIARGLRGFEAWPSARRVRTKVGGCCRLRQSVTGWVAARRPRSAAWIVRPCATGFTGSMGKARRDCSTNGRPTPRLSTAQLAELVTIVETGPDLKTDGVVCWWRVDLQVAISARFGVDYHQRYVGKLPKKLGFSHKSARPRHPAAG